MYLIKKEWHKLRNKKDSKKKKIFLNYFDGLTNNLTKCLNLHEELAKKLILILSLLLKEIHRCKKNKKNKLENLLFLVLLIHL